MSARRDDEYDDLAALLDDLEATLAQVREELDRRRDGRGSRRDDPRRGGADDRAPGRGRSERSGFAPGPESGRSPSREDVVGPTDEYTVPALVALLDATSRLLDVVSRTLRQSGAGRSGWGNESGGATGDDRWSRGSRRPTGPVGSAASEALDRALAELRRALSESDLPDEGGIGTLFEDARRLSREVSDRVDDARRDVDRGGRRDDGWGGEGVGDSSGEDDGSSPIRIEVEDEADAGTDAETDAGEGDDGTGDSAGEASDDEGVSIDVEAELDSIREEVHGGESEAAGDDGESDEGTEDEAGPGDEASSDDDENESDER